MSLFYMIFKPCKEYLRRLGLALIFNLETHVIVLWFKSAVKVQVHCGPYWWAIARIIVTVVATISFPSNHNISILKNI
jgi:hypothetical protein